MFEVIECVDITLRFMLFALHLQTLQLCRSGTSESSWVKPCQASTALDFAEASCHLPVSAPLLPAALQVATVLLLHFLTDIPRTLIMWAVG